MKRSEKGAQIELKIRTFMARHPRLKMSSKRVDRRSIPRTGWEGFELTFSFKDQVGTVVHADDVTQVNAVAMFLVSLFPRYSIFLDSMSKGVFVYQMQRLRSFPIF
jgi:hypothetical protein